MRNLLVVEDETLIRLGMKVMLDWEEQGIRWAGEASNGQEALNVLERTHVDLVITDIRMPVMDGIELMRICRDQYPHIRFIILSSYDDFHYAQEALHLGAFDYILKPTMNTEDMHSSIKRVLATMPIEKLEGEPEKTDISSSQVELLKELILERALQQAELDLRNEEKGWYLVPFWNGPIHLALFTLPDMVSQSETSLWNGLIVVLKEHIQHFPMEMITYRSQSILLYTLAEQMDLNEWHTWQEDLNWKIKCSLDRSPIWEERLNQLNWQHIRRAIKELLLNMHLTRNDNKSELVQTALEYIQIHFHEAIGLNQVADFIGVTPTYLSRIFKLETGHTFIHHISHLRIELTKSLLLNPKHTAASVGKEVGYPNPRYFSKWFKEMTGITPGGFRHLQKFSKNGEFKE